MKDILFQAETSPMLQSPPIFRQLAIWMLLIVLVLGLCLFTPWQQTVVGTGRVTVFSPSFRPQTVEAQMSGRLKRWLVTEGQPIQKGQLLAELVDTDPKFLDPNQIETLKRQQQALKQRRKSSEGRLNALNKQWIFLSQSRQSAIPGAQEKVLQNRARMSVAQQSLLAAKQNKETAEANFQRLKTLYAQGLRSQRDFQLAELDKVRADTSVSQALAQWEVARREIQVSSLDQGKVTGDTAAAMASVSSAMAAAQESIATADTELAKLQVDYQNLKQRMALRSIVAPITGRVVRLLHLGSGETVLEGDVMATVVPDTQDQAVELYVSDWDTPLVQVGRQVRLQFAGWPAIQFSGWPSIATGTFGGRVALVDAVDDGKGKYRILVKPDVTTAGSHHDTPWPQPNFLRPGTGATGWILLDTVPLGYELWRQFNAFPLSLQQKPPSSADKADDKEKSPKRKKSK